MKVKVKCLARSPRKPLLLPGTIDVEVVPSPRWMHSGLMSAFPEAPSTPELLYTLGQSKVLSYEWSCGILPVMPNLL